MSSKVIPQESDLPIVVVPIGSFTIFFFPPSSLYVSTVEENEIKGRMSENEKDMKFVGLLSYGIQH